MIQFASSRSLPSFLPTERCARFRLPSSGSFGPQFPTFSDDSFGHPSVLCSTTTSDRPSRQASLFARLPIPRVLPCICVPSRRARCEAGSSPQPTGLLVYRYPLSSGPITRGVSRISQVPELPLWMHAPLFRTTVVLWGLALTLGFGGLSFSFEMVLNPAPIVVECAPSTSAFRFDDSVGFPSRFVGKLSSDHNDDVFRGSITRPASSLHPAPDPRSRGRLRVHYGPAG